MEEKRRGRYEEDGDGDGEGEGEVKEMKVVIVCHLLTSSFHRLAASTAS